MSRVSFRTEDGKLVVAGWDVPLSGYFLTVYDVPKEDSDEDEPEFLYESLDDDGTHHGFHPETAYFKAKLTGLGIAAVPGFWELVEKNEGNRQYRL